MSLDTEESLRSIHFPVGLVSEGENSLHRQSQDILSRVYAPFNGRGENEIFDPIVKLILLLKS